MITFEEFILRQIVRRTVQYNRTDGRFVHCRNDIGSVAINKILHEEGLARGYEEDRIRHERDAVVNNMGQLLSRTKRNVISFEVEDHLPLGGLVEVSGHLDRSPITEKQTLLLMRVSRNDFFVVESNRPDVIPLASIYRLEDSTYLSTIQGEKIKPFLFRNKNQLLKLVISNLNFVTPSTWEQVLDRNWAVGDNKTEDDKVPRLHPNPMALLLHEYSSSLNRYIDVADNQPTGCHLGSEKVSDITEFINAVKIHILGSISADEVVRIYPDWFQFCVNNHIPIMALDTIVNKLWSIKGRL